MLQHRCRCKEFKIFSCTISVLGSDLRRTWNRSYRNIPRWLRPPAREDQRLLQWGHRLVNLHFLNALDWSHRFGICSGSIHKVGRGLGKTPFAWNCDIGHVAVPSQGLPCITLSNGLDGIIWEDIGLGTHHLHIAKHVINIFSACTALDLNIVPMAWWFHLGSSLRQQWA